MKGWARMSEDGLYRYVLGRSWSEGEHRLLWVMLNPSTADALVDDPTIRRCIGFAQREGYDELEVVNLYAYRATKPAELLAAHHRGVHIEGSDNATTIADAIAAADAVVVGWGAWLDTIVRVGPSRLHVERQAHMRSRPVFCLGTTATGQPRHPLYVKGDQPLVPWSLS